MIEETIQINKLNLQFENKFNDEYFLLINGIDNFLFEEKIYISNYGEVYNKSQSRLFDYENSTLNLRVINGGTKGFSRWNLTTNSFSMSNTEYESRRRLKKISYGYNIQNSKKDKIKKIYKTIRETGGWEHWELIELASYVCECREDALKIEQEWCEKLRPNLNSNSPFV